MKGNTLIIISIFVSIGIGCNYQPTQKDDAKEVVSDSNPPKDTIEYFDYETWLLQNRVPMELQNLLSPTWNDYNYYFEMNPFYLRGDFDGDGNNDIAILVENKDHKKGILIYHSNSGQHYILGAGNSFNGDDNFNWLHIWYVYKKGKVEFGPGEEKDIHLIGEAIYVAKDESASALIYWDGSKYQSYQQGD